MTKFLPAFAAALALTAGAAAAASTAITTGNTALGTVLTNGKGLTLYTFDKDTAGISNCYDMCAANWPPLEASAKARPQDEFGIIIRADGTRQWAHKGQPLYLWFKDAAAGDTTGDGVKGVWHVAKP